MSRPLYETEQDRKNEIEVAEIICKMWGCNYVKLKPLYEVDFALLRFDDVKGILEVRCRNYSWEDLNARGGLMISIHKWHAIKKWHTEFPLTVVFALRLTDGIYAMIQREGYAFENPDPFKIKYTGSTHKRDKWDVEPLVLLPMKMFRKIANVETVPAKVA